MSNKKLIEGDIFYVIRNGKYVFGKILMDVHTRILEKEPTHNYKFFDNCYLVEVYAGIYDKPELQSRTVVVPSNFCFKKTFYSKNYKIDWTFYQHEPINYTELDFPETMQNAEKKICFRKFDLLLPTKIKTFEEMDTNYKYYGVAFPSYYALVDIGFHYQDRDDLMAFTHPGGYLENTDLRFNPEKRIEIYNQMGEDINTSYYELAQKHNMDIARFYK